MRKRDHRRPLASPLRRRTLERRPRRAACIDDDESPFDEREAEEIECGGKAEER